MNLMPAIIQVFFLFSYVHPLHVSVTEINFDEQNKKLEIMSRIFIDDLEKSLRNSLKQPTLNLLEPGNGLTIDQMAERYLADHIKISLDNKPQKITYLGHEQDGEAFVFYTSVNKVKKWKTVNILNDVITETYDDQSNLVHVTVGEKIKSLRLTRQKPVDKLTFDP